MPSVRHPSSCQGRPAILALALAAAACSGISSEVPSPDSGVPPGFTACGSAPCQPGQYCSDLLAGRCDPGCQGGANCAADQDCVKPADAGVGSCQQHIPDAQDGDSCSQSGACQGGVLYCYFRPGDPHGVCRHLCTSPMDCVSAGILDTACCQSQASAYSACEPVMIAPVDGTCQ